LCFIPVWAKLPRQQSCLTVAVRYGSAAGAELDCFRSSEGGRVRSRTSCAGRAAIHRDRCARVEPSRDGAGGETNELSEAGMFLCLSCAHEWSAPIGAAGCTAYRHKYVQCTDYEAFARRAVSPTARVLRRLPSISGRKRRRHRKGIQLILPNGHIDFETPNAKDQAHGSIRPGSPMGLTCQTS
jgi:hypothetical protein